MVNVPMRSTAPLDNGSLSQINQIRVQNPVASGTVQNINNGCPAHPVNGNAPAAGGVTSSVNRMPVQPQPSVAPSPAPQTNPAYNQVTSYQQTTPAYGQQTSPTYGQQTSPAYGQQSSPTYGQQSSPVYGQQPTAPAAPQSGAPAAHPVPQLLHKTMKGQKTGLETGTALTGLKACLGWSVTNPACDLDVSAFLLNTSGKVLGDEWFVFYGQTTSPDGSTRFSTENGADMESITIDLSRLNPQVNQIVFVLTINEALEKHLNFSMVKDAYVRILDPVSGNEIVSFLMDEYYANVTSMMIGAVYKHNGQWKFNAMGSGVARDLAGLCEYYGVVVE